MGFYADSTIERDFDEYVGYKNGEFDDDPEYRESYCFHNSYKRV